MAPPAAANGHRRPHRAGAAPVYELCDALIVWEALAIDFTEINIGGTAG